VARRRGKTIEDRAKQVRATGARLSAAKQALRDSLIVQRKAQNWPLEAIAAEAKVTVRTVSRVLEQREAVGEALLDRDPIDVVKQMAAQFEASIGDFEAMAYAYGETHPSAAVGAKKGADQAREKLIMLLQATGRMPRDLGGLGDLMGMRELASEMVDAVRAFKRGEADADHVEETFTRALGLGLSLRARVKRMTLRSIAAVPSGPCFHVECRPRRGCSAPAPTHAPRRPCRGPCYRARGTFARGRPWAPGSPVERPLQF